LRSLEKIAGTSTPRSAAHREIIDRNTLNFFSLRAEEKSIVLEHAMLLLTTPEFGRNRTMFARPSPAVLNSWKDHEGKLERNYLSVWPRSGQEEANDD